MSKAAPRATLHLCISLFVNLIAASEPGESPIAAEWVAASDVQENWTNSSILDELIPYLGNGVRETLHARLSSFNASLHPIYASTPKNKFGRLGHAAVRYILNRLFVQKHGWFVNGLYELHGSNRYDTVTMTEALLKYVPVGAQHAFERRLSWLGLDEKEIGMLAATIESVVLSDAVEELLDMCKMWNVSLDGKGLRPRSLDWLMQLMVATRNYRLLDKGESYFRRTSPDMLLRNIARRQPDWPRTVQWLLQLRRELEPERSWFDRATVLRMAHEMERRFSRWSAMDECQPISKKLIAIEEGRNTGCVRLADFYKRSNDPVDGWMFSENPDYLRKQGVLDESDPSNPRLLIANYVNSPGNCVPFSKFYMACCISQCESLMTHIEGALQAPDALPEDIIAIVKAMPPKSAPDHTVLSPQLLVRLQETADAHGGQVPLHSRLFMQWLHFAYPRECPFPRVSGSVAKTQGVMRNYGDSTQKAVQQNTKDHYIKLAMKLTSSSAEGTCTAWRYEEEIYIAETHSATTSIAALEEDMSVWACVYFSAALAVIALMWATVVQRSGRKQPKRTMDSAMLV